MYYIDYPETVGYVSRQSASEPPSRQPKIDRNRLERFFIGLVSHPNKCQIGSLIILAVMGNLGANSSVMRTVCHVLWEHGCVLGRRAIDRWKWSASISFGTGSILLIWKWRYGHVHNFCDLRVSKNCGQNVSRWERMRTALYTWFQTANVIWLVVLDG